MNAKSSFASRSLAVSGILLRCASLVLPGLAFGQVPMYPASDTSTTLAAQHQRKTLQERLNELGATLQLTGGQTPLWRAYTDAALNQSRARKQWLQANPRSDVLTLPQRIDRRTAMLQQLQPGHQQMDIAMKQMYAALSPAQQLTLELEMAHHRRERGGPWSAG
jgi:hypothetical protein